MDFSFNDVQQMLADSVEKFVDTDYDFDTRQRSTLSDRGYSPETWQLFADLGWTAVPFSEADGGFDGGPIELMILMQQFGRGLVVEPYLANVVLAGGILRRAASEAQKSDWLGPLIAGQLQAALAFVEPQSRYDLADIATAARADNDGWLLDGRKGVVFNGGNAELLIVPARTGGDQSAKDGITLFGIPATSAGVSVRAFPTMDGHRAAEIRFDDVRAPQDAVIGTAGAGFGPLHATINEATLAVCAEAVGIMQVMTQKTVEYTKNRVQFGVPISSFQALQHRMVDMLTACEQSYSLLLWATMAGAEQTEEAESAISAIKYQVGTAGRRVGEEAVQLHGGMGVTWELDIAHYFKRLTAIGQMFGSADWHLDKLSS